MKRLFIVCGLIPEMEWICEGVVKLRWKNGWYGTGMSWVPSEIAMMNTLDDFQGINVVRLRSDVLCWSMKCWRRQ